MNTATMIRSPITPPTVPSTMPIFEPWDEPSKESQDYQMPKVMTYICSVYSLGSATNAQ
jgi:hypothetical protein